jgi:hypothetical protein
LATARYAPVKSANVIDRHKRGKLFAKAPAIKLSLHERRRHLRISPSRLCATVNDAANEIGAARSGRYRFWTLMKLSAAADIHKIAKNHGQACP